MQKSPKVAQSMEEYLKLRLAKQKNQLRNQEVILTDNSVSQDSNASREANGNSKVLEESFGWTESHSHCERIEEHSRVEREHNESSEHRKAVRKSLIAIKMRHAVSTGSLNSVKNQQNPPAVLIEAVNGLLTLFKDCHSSPEHNNQEAKNWKNMQIAMNPGELSKMMDNVGLFENKIKEENVLMALESLKSISGQAKNKIEGHPLVQTAMEIAEYIRLGIQYWSVCNGEPKPKEMKKESCQNRRINGTKNQKKEEKIQGVKNEKSKTNKLDSGKQKEEDKEKEKKLGIDSKQESLKNSKVKEENKEKDKKEQNGKVQNEHSYPQAKFLDDDELRFIVSEVPQEIKNHQNASEEESKKEKPVVESKSSESNPGSQNNQTNQKETIPSEMNKLGIHQYFPSLLKDLNCLNGEHQEWASSVLTSLAYLLASFGFEQKESKNKRTPWRFAQEVLQKNGLAQAIEKLPIEIITKKGKSENAILFMRKRQEPPKSDKKQTPKEKKMIESTQKICEYIDLAKKLIALLQEEISHERPVKNAKISSNSNGRPKHLRSKTPDGLNSARCKPEKEKIENGLSLSMAQEDLNTEIKKEDEIKVNEPIIEPNPVSYSSVGSSQGSGDKKNAFGQRFEQFFIRKHHMTLN